MQKNLKILASLAVLLITVVCLHTGVLASSMGFSIDPAWPENQVGDSGFYDLRVQPGQSQELTIGIANLTDEDIVVSVEVVTASTNRNGIVDYGNSANTDETLVHSFEEIATVREPRITIPGGQTADAVIHLDFPEESFDGILLGGINITKELSDEDIRSGGTIVNQYSYVLALRATQNETAVTPSFELGELGTELVDYRASFVAPIRNTQPLLVKNVGVNVEIYAAGSDTPLAEFQKDNVEFAPHSVYPLYLVDREGRGISAGDYTANIRIDYEGQSWEFDESFTVAAAQAANVNESALNQNSGQTAAGTALGLPLWAIIALSAGGMLLLVVVILLIVVLRRNKSMAAKDPMYAGFVPPIPPVPTDDYAPGSGSAGTGSSIPPASPTPDSNPTPAPDGEGQ